MADKKDTSSRSHPMLIRLPQDMLARLRSIARQRALPDATAARQLLKERMDQIDKAHEHEGLHDEL